MPDAGEQSAARNTDDALRILAYHRAFAGLPPLTTLAALQQRQSSGDAANGPQGLADALLTASGFNPAVQQPETAQAPVADSTSLPAGSMNMPALRQSGMGGYGGAALSSSFADTLSGQPSAIPPIPNLGSTWKRGWRPGGGVEIAPIEQRPWEPPKPAKDILRPAGEVGQRLQTPTSDGLTAMAGNVQRPQIDLSDIFLKLAAQYQQRMFR